MTDLFNWTDDPATDEWERVNALVADLHQQKDPRCEHRLLGSVHEMMGADMREHAQRFYAQRPGVRATSRLNTRQKNSWMMLATFGSDVTIKQGEGGQEWVWGDMGSICFWIRRPDLEKLNFARAVAVIGGSG